jgi:hypothetical protein
MNRAKCPLSRYRAFAKKRGKKLWTMSAIGLLLVANFRTGRANATGMKIGYD